MEFCYLINNIDESRISSRDRYCIIVASKSDSGDSQFYEHFERNKGIERGRKHGHSGYLMIDPICSSPEDYIYAVSLNEKRKRLDKEAERQPKLVSSKTSELVTDSDTLVNAPESVWLENGLTRELVKHFNKDETKSNAVVDVSTSSSLLLATNNVGESSVSQEAEKIDDNDEQSAVLPSQTTVVDVVAKHLQSNTASSSSLTTPPPPPPLPPSPLLPPSQPSLPIAKNNETSTLPSPPPPPLPPSPSSSSESQISQQQTLPPPPPPQPTTTTTQSSSSARDNLLAEIRNFKFSNQFQRRRSSRTPLSQEDDITIERRRRLKDRRFAMLDRSFRMLNRFDVNGDNVNDNDDAAAGTNTENVTDNDDDDAADADDWFE